MGVERARDALRYRARARVRARNRARVRRSSARDPRRGVWGSLQDRLEATVHTGRYGSRAIGSSVRHAVHQDVFGHRDVLPCDRRVLVGVREVRGSTRDRESTENEPTENAYVTRPSASGASIRSSASGAASGAASFNYYKLRDSRIFFCMEYHGKVRYVPCESRSSRIRVPGMRVREPVCTSSITRRSRVHGHVHDENDG